MVLDLDFEKAYEYCGVWKKNGMIDVLSNILMLKSSIETPWHIGLNVEQILEKIFSKCLRSSLNEREAKANSQGKNLVKVLLGMICK
ncbi:MAG: hypothetical protein QXX79_02265 [Candidatus Bathyarchaeia archaeon]